MHNGEEVSVTRIHLKTGHDRKALIDFCLGHREQQYVVIGWSGAYEDSVINNYGDYYEAIKKHYPKLKKICQNVFSRTKENDLFWTRDLDGYYWICRAKDVAQPMHIPEWDVGAAIPVEAYRYGMEVPGQIIAAFIRRPTCEQMSNDAKIVEFSKKIYNELSKSLTYKVDYVEGDFIDNLPPFDLEELVISYIQIKHNYYLLSNSIAKNSTTINIECEFRGYEINNPKKAVVQVKGGKDIILDAVEFEKYIADGYIVYLYAPKVINSEKYNNCITISREELRDFYYDYRTILPESITKWEDILKSEK